MTETYRQPDAVVAEMLRTRLVPNVSVTSVEMLMGIAGAAVSAGCPLLEITNRNEAVAEVFAAAAGRLAIEMPDLILGAGTITGPAAAEQFISAGATFIVGPNFHAEVARVCRARNVLYIPGCATPTEVAMALEQGARLIKIFPAAQLGGPAFIKALRGPFPNAQFMPSGGVTIEAAAILAWFGAGAACLSIGSDLFPADALAAGDWELISRGIAAAVAATRRPLPD